ncbi:MAG: DUF3176 domain-containing protein [Candidatus Riflebacteria bacterium]|nr:DUF3176 domain-containing protein [Candidatus Riflebacteria bacterium]
MKLNSHQKQQLVALSSALIAEWWLSLDDSMLVDELRRFDAASSGVLGAARTILTAKILLKNHNQAGVKPV